MKFRLRNPVLASASFYQETDILDHWFPSLFLVEFLMKCKNVSMMFAPLVSHIPVTYLLHTCNTLRIRVHSLDNVTDKVSIKVQESDTVTGSVKMKLPAL